MANLPLEWNISLRSGKFLIFSSDPFLANIKHQKELKLHFSQCVSYEICFFRILNGFNIGVSAVSLSFVKDWKKDLDRTRSFLKEWKIRGSDDILKKGSEC